MLPRSSVSAYAGYRGFPDSGHEFRGFARPGIVRSWSVIGLLSAARLTLVVAGGDMDFLVATAVGALGQRLTDALVDRAVRGARKATIGTPEQQAIRRACGKAVERAVKELSGAGASDEDVAHALGLTERLIDRGGFDSLRTASSTREGMPRGEWQRVFDELGYDPETFPVSFEQLVEHVTTYLADELRREAREPGSPLLGAVVLDDLDVVIADITQLAAEFQRFSLARLVPLSREVEAALDVQRSVCEAIDRPFFTADLLLALLTMTRGRVAKCFDQAKPGTAAEIRQGPAGVHCAPRIGDFR